MSETSKSHRADCPYAASWPLLIETTAFALYFFVWKLCMAATLARAPRLAEVGVLGSTYARLLAFTGLGYVLFWVAHSYLPTQKHRKIAVAFVLALCLVGSIGMMATRRIESLLLASCATVLAIGYIGAGIHYDFSLVSHGSEFFGRALGIGMAASSLLQYAVEVMAWTPVVFVVCVVLSLSAITWLVTRPANSRRLEQDPSAKQTPIVGGRPVVILVIAAVAMTFNYGLLDSVLVWKYASGEIISVGLSKIVYILSLPLAGVLFDLKKGNLRSLITVCVMFLIAVATPAAETDGWLGMATVMAGVYGAFYVMYLSASFMRIAPDTSRPEVIASVGRAVSCFVGAIGALTARPFFESCGMVATVGVSCLLSIGCLLILLRDIAWGVVKGLGKDDVAFGGDLPQPSGPSRVEALSTYVEKLGLTAREAQVCSLLLSTDLGVQEIADELFISRRVAQRHIASIYEKAGVTTRIGLYRDFDVWFDEAAN